MGRLATRRPSGAAPPAGDVLTNPAIETYEPDPPLPERRRARPPHAQRRARRGAGPARPQRRGQDHHRPAAQRGAGPNGGWAKVLGVDPEVDPNEVRRHTGVLTEHAGLDERLTAVENLLATARIRGLDDQLARRRIGEMLERFGMSDRADEPVRGASTGQRKRIALARALLHEPEVLFLDEPTSGLDPSAIRDVVDLIGTLATEHGRTVVLCTHFLGEAGQLADRMAVLSHGRLHAFGKPSELAVGAVARLAHRDRPGRPAHRRARRRGPGRARRAARPRPPQRPRGGRRRAAGAAPADQPPRRARRGGFRRGAAPADARGRLLRDRGPAWPPRAPRSSTARSRPPWPHRRQPPASGATSGPTAAWSVRPLPRRHPRPRRRRTPRRRPDDRRRAVPTHCGPRSRGRPRPCPRCRSTGRPCGRS